MVGCGRQGLIEDIEYREKILIQYPDPSGATILVTRWGTFTRKWRITDDAFALLYQVDSNTQVCQVTAILQEVDAAYHASAGYLNNVDCDALRRDRDMQQYITW